MNTFQSVRLVWLRLLFFLRFCYFSRVNQCFHTYTHKWSNFSPDNLHTLPSRDVHDVRMFLQRIALNQRWVCSSSMRVCVCMKMQLITCVKFYRLFKWEAVEVNELNYLALNEIRNGALNIKQIVIRLQLQMILRWFLRPPKWIVFHIQSHGN